MYNVHGTLLSPSLLTRHQWLIGHGQMHKTGLNGGRRILYTLVPSPSTISTHVRHASNMLRQFPYLHVTYVCLVCVSFVFLPAVECTMYNIYERYRIWKKVSFTTKRTIKGA